MRAIRIRIQKYIYIYTQYTTLHVYIVILYIYTCIHMCNYVYIYTHIITMGQHRLYNYVHIHIPIYISNAAFAFQDSQWSSWSQDACPSWDWSGWGRQDHSRSWSSWDHWDDWDTTAAWNSWGQGQGTSDEAARMQSLLQRGHTVDRLSEEDLQEVVRQIDALKAKRNQTDPSQEAASAPGHNSKADPPASPKHGSARKTPKSGKKRKSPKKSPEKAEDKDEKDASTSTGQQQASSSAKDESKQQRKKRLHARYMRFSRSLVSSSLSYDVIITLGHVHVLTARTPTANDLIRSQHAAGDQKIGGEGLAWHLGALLHV